MHNKAEYAYTNEEPNEANDDLSNGVD